MSTYVQGAATLADGQSEFNALSFHMQAMINRISTAEPVRVVSAQPGGAGPAGVVSVQPLVNLVDGEGNGHAQGTLFNLPYARVQGGENAVICDPKPGDVGLAVYAMRDTEAVKQGRGQARANPGSARLQPGGRILRRGISQRRAQTVRHDRRRGRHAGRRRGRPVGAERRPPDHHGPGGH